jgi:hypothetical protein
MEDGTVTDIPYRKPNGRNPAVVFIDDEKYSFFADHPVDLDGVQKGDKVEFSYTQDGEHSNLTHINVLEKGDKSEQTSTADQAKRRGAAAKCGAWIESGTDNPTSEGAIEKAEKMLDWMEEGREK